MSLFHRDKERSEELERARRAQREAHERDIRVVRSRQQELEERLKQIRWMMEVEAGLPVERNS